MAFDTLEFVRRLEEVGVSRAQAEAHVTVLRDVVFEDVATRSDVSLLKDELRRTEERLETKITSDLKLLETRLAIRLGGVVAAVVGVMGVLFRIFT